MPKLSVDLGKFCVTYSMEEFRELTLKRELANKMKFTELEIITQYFFENIWIK